MTSNILIEFNLMHFFLNIRKIPKFHLTKKSFLRRPSQNPLPPPPPQTTQINI